MKKLIHRYNLAALILLFIVIPIFLYLSSNVPERSFLKELISLITVISLIGLLIPFYLVRNKPEVLKLYKHQKLVKWHKAIGYVFIFVLFFHPLLIVLPRNLEGGITAIDAFFKMITTLDNTGIMLGIIAWILMLLVAFTAIFREQLPISYSKWRLIHTILTSLFLTIAIWHSYELGRHMNVYLNGYILCLFVYGLYINVNAYLNKSQTAAEEEDYEGA